MMVPNTEYITNGFLCLNTSNGEIFRWNTSQEISNISDEVHNIKTPLHLNTEKEVTFSCKITNYDSDCLARLMGYKNHNCYCRAIRRQKRKKKQYKKLMKKLKNSDIY